MPTKEEIMAKAQAKLAAMKATTEDAPTLEVKRGVPKLVSPNYDPLKVPPKDHAPVMRFWSSNPTQKVYPPGRDPIEFRNHKAVVSHPLDIVFLRTLTKQHQHKFKVLE